MTGQGGDVRSRRVSAACFHVARGFYFDLDGHSLTRMERMKRSTDRILTTHMGSLPRPDVLADLLVAQAEGKPVDTARIPALTDEAMDLIVRRQLDCGIDVGNDGEMPRS